MKARLLVCSRDSVFYNTAQYLSKLLSSLGTTASSFIKDSGEFCEKLQNIPNPGRMVSYDVVDLFTNVPREEALKILRKRIDSLDNPLETYLSTDNIILLLKQCISSTYFSWGDDFYEQTNGLPMGSPLSPLISEIFLTDLEEKALQTSTVTPTCFFRQVDDTFVIINQQDDPETLLQHLNRQHPRIKFTMETENDNQLPFLDVCVSKTNNSIRTGVYRKPTHTDQYIHFKSNHPNSVKSATISTLVNRAKKICDPESLSKEIDHLKHVFTNFNGYPEKFVTNTINKTLSASAAKPKTPLPQSESSFLSTAKSPTKSKGY
ncbi:uncharacterized protein LOC126816066 [Patella vulgata]|uniref:uncharacterized protein LOC126816066 n=1 Tax=Patella vulgata TaxID=6465 RepID=UPI00218013ED|nr:uncharacterized protein LOC126816066 [Patella vulgata]XP_050398208.1 uncharacterized protein LOC126816066 [Patella vulgata]XP_050398216.1 uncharacterized protein LOC126816066 [Patella vulgata]